MTLVLWCLAAAASFGLYAWSLTTFAPPSGNDTPDIDTTHK